MTQVRCPCGKPVPPNKNGANYPRKWCSTACRSKESSRRYCQKNPENAREASRRYRQKNPEKVREEKRRRRQEDLEKARKQDRERNRCYRQKNPEKVREWNSKGNRRYRQAHPEKVLERNRRRNAERNYLAAIWHFMAPPTQEEPMTQDLQEKRAPELDALLQSFNRLSDDDLKKVLAEELQRTRTSLLRASAAYHVAKRRGLKPGMSRPFRRLFENIAEGKWSPDAYIRFGGEPYVFEKLKSLPREKQDEVLKGTDEEVKKAVEEIKTAEPATQRTRHAVTISEHEELKRKCELLEVENRELRRQVTQLEKALDALTGSKRKTAKAS